MTVSMPAALAEEDTLLECMDAVALAVLSSDNVVGLVLTLRLVGDGAPAALAEDVTLLECTEAVAATLSPELSLVDAAPAALAEDWTALELTEAVAATLSALLLGDTMESYAPVAHEATLTSFAPSSVSCVFDKASGPAPFPSSTSRVLVLLVLLLLARRLRA